MSNHPGMDSSPARHESAGLGSSCSLAVACWSSDNTRSCGALGCQQTVLPQAPRYGLSNATSTRGWNLRPHLIGFTPPRHTVSDADRCPGFILIREVTRLRLAPEHRSCRYQKGLRDAGLPYGFRSFRPGFYQTPLGQQRGLGKIQVKITVHHSLSAHRRRLPSDNT